VGKHLVLREALGEKVVSIRGWKSTDEKERGRRFSAVSTHLVLRAGVIRRYHALGDIDSDTLGRVRGKSLGSVSNIFARIHLLSKIGLLVCKAKGKRRRNFPHPRDIASSARIIKEPDGFASGILSVLVDPVGPDKVYFGADLLDYLVKSLPMLRVI